MENTATQDGICSVWLLNASRFGFLNKSYYYYRIRQNSISTSDKDAGSYDHLLRVAYQIEDYYLKFMDNDVKKKNFVLIRLLDSLLVSNAAKNYYKLSSAADREIIVKKTSKYFRESKLFNSSTDKNALDVVFGAFNDFNPKLKELKGDFEKKDFSSLEDQLPRIFQYGFLKLPRARYRLYKLFCGDLKSLKVIVKYLTPYLMILVGRKLIKAINEMKKAF